MEHTFCQHYIEKLLISLHLLYSVELLSFFCQKVEEKKVESEDTGCLKGICPLRNWKIVLFSNLICVIWWILFANIYCKAINVFPIDSPICFYHIYFLQFVMPKLLQMEERGRLLDTYYSADRGQGVSAQKLKTCALFKLNSHDWVCIHFVNISS